MIRRFRPKLDMKKPFVAISSQSSLVFKTGSQRSEKPVFTNKVAPCRHACPIGINIPAAFHLASRGDIDAALQIYLQDNPLPGICGRVCYHPCESKCNRGKYDEPINIRGFERFLADRGRVDLTFEPGSVAGKKRVAVVGSGPAGLSAAYHLTRLGHQITLVEARAELGGMLRYGIPSFRLPRTVLDQEIGRIVGLGIKTKTNTRVGDDQGWKEFDGYDAVFLAVGQQRGKRLFESGGLQDRIFTGVDFLADPEKSTLDDAGKKTIIVGGGNVAIDVARTLLRIRGGNGCNISVVCPEPQDQMPVLPDDLAEALEEDLDIENGWVPVALKEDSQGQIAIQFRQAEVKKDDATGSIDISPIGDQRRQMEADNIIVAVGQKINIDVLPQQIKLSLGRIDTDPYGRTSNPDFFAGGDAAGGSAYVADAIAGGKMGAMAIHCYLSAGDIDAQFKCYQLGISRAFSFKHFLQQAKVDSENLKRVVAFDQINTLFFSKQPRLVPPAVDPRTRKSSFVEVVDGTDPADMEQEIARCFNCGTCIDCENCLDFCPDISVLKDARTGKYDFNSDYCKGCGMCSVACPRNIIDMEKDSA